MRTSPRPSRKWRSSSAHSTTAPPWRSARARLDRFGFDVELIALALALGATIAEIPVRWRNSPDTRVTLWQGAKAFADPLRVRANFALRRYRLAPQRVFHRHPLPLASRTR